MHTETTFAARPRGNRSGYVVLLVVLVAVGIYVGMRWHTTFERWLVPTAAPSPTSASTSTPSQPKQLWTCGMHPQVIQDHSGDCPICHMKLTPMASAAVGKTDPSADGATVLIEPAVVQNMGVRIAEVTEGLLSQTVRVSATVREAEAGYRDVNLRASGWIQTLYADTDGMEVKKGGPLFDLYSPDLRLAIEELISARKAVNLAVGEETAALSGTAASLIAAAESRLASLDLTPEQISALGAMEHAPSEVTILSPIDGHVTEKGDVFTGSSVTAGQRVLRLSQRGTMWAEGRVPEGEVGRVRVGQKARAWLGAFPGRAFEGEVVFIHPHVDEATRTALVRMTLPNHDGALRHGMFATIDIDMGDGRPAVLVPREAVIDSGESQVVFVSVGKGRFEPRAVVMGRRSEHGLVQVLSGLRPGEQVVASGQFLVDSESRLREAIAKFLGQGATPALAPSAPAVSVPSKPATPPTTAINAGNVDAIVAAYLSLAQSLGTVQENDTPLQMDALASALHAMPGDATTPESLRVVTRAAQAAEAMKGQTLDKQRVLFKNLSESLIALVDAMPPSPSVSESLYVINCPMAEADWLQRSQDIANPYYASEMKECGFVVRSVPAKGAN